MPCGKSGRRGAPREKRGRERRQTVEAAGAAANLARGRYGPTVPLAPNAVVLGGLRVARRRRGVGPAATFEATTGEWIVALPARPAPRRDPGVALELAQRFALGAPGVIAPRAIERVELSGDHWLLLAYAVPAGESLDQRLESGPLSATDAEALILGIARTLEHLHDRGVCHGALRPEWIVVDGTRVSLVGFGVDAALHSVGAKLDALAGPFAAPEITDAPEEPPTPAADVFAVAQIARALIGPAVNGGGGTAASPSPLMARALLTRPRERPASVLRVADAAVEALTPATGAPAPAPPPAAESARKSEPSLDPPVETTANADVTKSDATDPPQQPIPSSGSETGTDSAGHEPGPARNATRSAPWALLSVIAGVSLLLIGVTALFAYAMTRESPAVVPSVTPVASVAAAPDASPTAVAPAPPVPSAVPAPSVPLPPSPPADDPPESAQAPPPTSPLVRSGDQDGVAPLPVDRHTPAVGPADALVTVLVFGDLECPHTRRLIPELGKLRVAFPRDLRVAWRHRPLSNHPNARGAAEVAQGVYLDRGDQRFWALLGAAAESTDPATRRELDDWLSTAGVASTADQWLGKPRPSRDVERDLTSAGLFAVHATPTLFINGARSEGAATYRELEHAVRQEMSAARALLLSGVHRNDVYEVRSRKNLIDLGRDVPTRVCPDIDGAPSRGPDDALVTIVEYSDFECSYCRKLLPSLDAVLAKHGGHVRLVWKNFPLPMHRRARPAAALALEAYADGRAPRFWRAHDLLFDARGELGDETLSRIAGQVGLDAGAALRAVQRGIHEKRIERDVQEGRRLGVSGTPTLFVNGRKVAGARPTPELMALVGEEIDWAKKLMSTGTSRGSVYDALCGGQTR